jgi:hypothetical protein
MNADFTAISYSPPFVYNNDDDSNYPYLNHTLTVDVKSPTFSVIYTDFKNRSNDLVIASTSVQTLFPDGKIEIIEG